MAGPQPEQRPASPWLLVGAVALSLVLVTVYVKEGDRGPLHLVRRGVQAVAAPVAAVGDWVTWPVRAATTWVGGFTMSKADVAELQAQNAELRKRNAELEEARLENERLKKLVGFAEAAGLDAKGAHVIGRPSSTWEGVVVLDLGFEDGVTTGMPVLSAQGVVGQVVESSLGSCRVRLITDQRSGAAALVQRTRATGVLRGSVDGGLTMDFVDRKFLPQRGDVVLTSGLGGVYPKGLLIGEVVDVDARPGDLFPHIVVESQVPFASLEEALVLVSAPPAVEGGAGE